MNWLIRIFLQGILREAEILEEVENGIRRSANVMIQISNGKDYMEEKNSRYLIM
jgi:hypothetical protein